MDTKIYSKTVHICKSRDDTLASVTMVCLLNVSDLVSVEGG